MHSPDIAQVLALLSDEELTEISQRAEIARDAAREPWPLVFEGLAVSAELALKARQEFKDASGLLPRWLAWQLGPVRQPVRRSGSPDGQVR